MTIFIEVPDKLREEMFYDLLTEIHDWLDDNNILYDLETSTTHTCELENQYICFEKEEDATAFKLRWL